MLWWNLEALSRLVERAVKGAMFQEFQEEVKRGVSLSFPPLFCWWLTCLLMAQMWAYLRCVLLCFEAVSKLSVNLDKSELHENSFLKMFIPLKKAIKCPWGLAQVVKGWRGFVGGYRFKSQWGPKIYLSKKNKKQKKGNQVTLIKSTLSKFTIIFMSTFIMPFSVSHIAEKLQQNLLWGNLEKEKLHLVEWKMACLPRGMVAWEWEK